MSELLVFGYVDSASKAPKEKMAAFAAQVSGLAGVEIAICRAGSYTELTELVHHKKVDLAWLPPIPLVALERHQLVKPLVSNHRDGSASFFSVIIVPPSSKIRNPRALKGTRAGWVDRHSASGYVLPRIGLAAVGVDPRAAFVAEKFFGSHEEVVKAVMSRRADFGATRAGLDAKGALTRAPWLDLGEKMDAVRVLATFGAIPADAIVARANLDEEARERMTSALVAVGQDKANQALVRELFGVDAFWRWTGAGYDELRVAAMDASAQGLLEGEERGLM